MVHVSRKHYTSTHFGVWSWVVWRDGGSLRRLLSAQPALAGLVGWRRRGVPASLQSCSLSFLVFVLASVCWAAPIEFLDSLPRPISVSRTGVLKIHKLLFRTASPRDEHCGRVGRLLRGRRVRNQFNGSKSLFMKYPFVEKISKEKMFDTGDNMALRR